MNVLSLFDGMSCGQIALERAGIKVDNYFASEIDKYAIRITQKNFPNTVQLGDVTKWREWILPHIDLIMGGSPCQGFSIAGKLLNFEDPRSRLFFEFIDILGYYKPKYFLLENVKMKREWEGLITNIINVKPVEINSSLVSAQNRKRLYWSNLPITQPEDRGILLKDILESDDIPVIKNHNKWEKREHKSQCLDANYFKGVDNHGQRTMIQVGSLYNNNADAGRIYSIEGKSKTLKGEGGGVGAKMGLISADDGSTYRKLTPVECERLQTVPDNYTEGVSDTQRYRMLGNGWTVDVIAHILKGINNENKEY